MKIIPTSKGNYTITDDEDFDWVNKHSWYDVKGYACTQILQENGKFKQVQMHRIIMNAPEDKFIDHINGDKSDNRRENLRIVTAQQNMWNTGKKNKETATSKYKGVYVERGRYIVKIKHDKHRESIGCFTNELAAANAYNYFANKYFGEYARLNEVEFMDKNEWEKYKVTPTSIYKGVSKVKDKSKWAVSVYDNKKKRNEIIGYFDDEIVAANYYNHLMKEKINQCEYISLDECEKLKCKKLTASIYKGVSWNSKRNKWSVIICEDKKIQVMGFFDDEVVAANYYNHLKGNKINQCNYISLTECESKMYKRPKTSKYDGVSWFKRDEVWEANVFHKGKRHYIGRFETEVEAALTYNKKIIELNIDKKLNVIESQDNKND